MTSTIKWLLGYPTTNDDLDDTSTTKRGLPASWYWNPDLYQLERRAIFSKKWILVAHKKRFSQPGDFVRFSQANYPFFLILDKNSEIRGFHNICRHRGFPVINEDKGTAKILACKYHGWSYGLNGKLAKAPYFDKFPDFDKENNGLFPIHVHLDAYGFVWVNLDAAETPEPWDSQFHGVDTQERMQVFDFDDYEYDHTWGMEGDYNWKTLADNYNECLHCKTTHPDSSGIVDVTVYRTEGQDGHIQHFNKRQEDGTTKAGGKIQFASTYYFPNACMTVSLDFFYMMRCVPTAPNKSSMEYDVYRNKKGDPEKFKEIDAIFKRVLGEDKWLCNETQRNLENGVYVNGQLHPSYESGPLYFQKLVKKALVEHDREERRAKKKIWPASQNINGFDKTNKEVSFCDGLDCSPQTPEVLAW